MTSKKLVKGKDMGYYDIYDSNDNLIASEVWIDDGSGYDSGPSRPIVVNWRKALIILMAIVGATNTFVLPLLLLANKDVFIQGGWILAALPSIILGLPLFIVGVMLLSAIKKANDLDSDDPVMEQAKAYVDSHTVDKSAVDKTDASPQNGSSTFVGTVNGTEIYSQNGATDDMTDEEYIEQKNAKYKYDINVSAVYLAIKFDKLISKLSLISYLLYPIGVLCFVAEALYGDTETYMILVGILNYLVCVLFALSIWKNYKRYKVRYTVSIAKRMLRVALVSLLVGAPVGLILTSTLQMGGHCILCLLAMFFDLACMIDSATAKSHSPNKKSKVHVGPIVIVAVVVGLVFTCIACALSIMPGPIYDALLAYDNGTSTDLTLPITVWSICAVVDVLLTVAISVAINKKLNKAKK